MIFLVNGPSRTATVGRTARKMGRRRPTPKQVKARERFTRMARAQSKARQSLSPSKQTRRTGGKMAAKKKRRRRKVTAKAAPRRKRRVTRKTRAPRVSLRRGGVTVYRSNRPRRRYRRNGLGGGIGRSLMTAGKDALAVIAGMAGTNLIARRIPFGEGSTAMVAGKKLAVAVGLSLIIGKVGSRGLAEKVLVGGVVAAATDLLRAVPGIGGALSGDDAGSLGAYPSVAALGDGGMGAWAGAGARVADPLAGYRS